MATARKLLLEWRLLALLSARLLLLLSPIYRKERTSGSAAAGKQRGQQTLQPDTRSCKSPKLTTRSTPRRCWTWCCIRRSSRTWYSCVWLNSFRQPCTISTRWSRWALTLKYTRVSRGENLRIKLICIHLHCAHFKRGISQKNRRARISVISPLSFNVNGICREQWVDKQCWLSWFAGNYKWQVWV